MEIGQASRVEDPELCDLYLGHANLDARYSKAPGLTLIPVPAEAALQEDLRRLNGIIGTLAGLGMPHAYARCMLARVGRAESATVTRFARN